MEDFNFYLCQNYLFVRVSAFYVSANSTRPNYCVWLMPAYFVFSVPNFFFFLLKDSRLKILFLQNSKSVFPVSPCIQCCQWEVWWQSESYSFVTHQDFFPLWQLFGIFFFTLSVVKFQHLCLGVSLLHLCRSALVKSFNMKILNFP